MSEVAPEPKVEFLRQIADSIINAPSMVAGAFCLITEEGVPIVQWFGDIEKTRLVVPIAMNNSLMTVSRLHEDVKKRSVQEANQDD